jgi:hypothetical protein
LFFFALLFGDGLGLRGSGFGAARSPIFGRKSDTPELWPGRGKFEANFGFFAANRTEKNYVAFLLVFGAVVVEFQQATAGDAGVKQDQRAVRVDGQRLCVLTKILALRVVTGHLNADLHQDTLAASADTCIGWVLQWLGHRGSRLPFNSL